MIGKKFLQRCQGSLIEERFRSLFKESLGYIILNQEENLNTLANFAVEKIAIIFGLSKNHSQLKPVEQLLTFRQPCPTESKRCIDDIYSWYI